jgi:uncharacterized membrane protein
MSRPSDQTAPTEPDERMRTLGRWALGGALLVAGTGHLTARREEFQAQVPDGFPIDADIVVLASGVIELALGLALLVARRRRTTVGWVVAGFFVAIFPGNIAQLVEGTDAFGLDSDLKRALRLPFQPVLVAWALWSTGAWAAWRASDERPPRHQGRGHITGA